VCDALQCLPPIELRLVGEVELLSIFVVVDQVDKRAERIKAFLESEGFRPELTTYAAATLEACDAHDVVVADSKPFGQGERVGVSAFPRTTSPIIAVGFLGTQLIEAHGLAMSSGYI